jgi:hypothetical protein
MVNIRVVVRTPTALSSLLKDLNRYRRGVQSLLQCLHESTLSQLSSDASQARLIGGGLPRLHTSAELGVRTRDTTLMKVWFTCLHSCGVVLSSSHHL